MKRILFLLLCLISSSLYAQYSAKGIVLDKETETALAFVNITYQSHHLYGTTTDIDGKFEINAPSQPLKINFSYVGYSNIQFLASQLPDTIYMDTTTDMLATVDLSASYNPAHRIIKHAVKNKESNNPNRLRSYEYQSYNKLVLEMEIDQEKWKEEKG